MNINHPTIEEAIALAALKHKGQKDKNGEVYIFHPISVMRRLETEEERIVGILHDVMEDCGVNRKELIDLGYSEDIVTAIEFLSKLPEEEDDYSAFIERIRKGPVLAIKGKLADLADNTDPARRTVGNEKTRKRQEKYRLAIGILTAELQNRSQVA